MKNSKKYILGLSDTHEAGACLLSNGCVIAAASEERFSRLKSDMGFPARSIDYCLNSAGISGQQISKVAFASTKSPALHIRIKREACFSIDDWVKEQNDYWLHRINGVNVSYHDIFSNNPKYIKDYSYNYEKVIGNDGSIDFDAFNAQRREKAASYLNIPLHDIELHLHEHCHGAYGYYGSVCREKALVFTCEGEGDYSNSTVSIYDNGNVDELYSTISNKIAHLYRYITLILGMKPNQHEYKVMGLAPYASDYEINKVLPILEELLAVVDGSIVQPTPLNDCYFTLIKKFQGKRFDGIAGALQRFLEKILSEWINFYVTLTGIGSIIVSGGVAQNIKAMKAIREIPGVRHVYVNPASGDGSLSIGASYLSWVTNFNECPEPLGTAYLGPDIHNIHVESALSENGLLDDSKYTIIWNVTCEYLANILAANCILGRAVGRMEFGQRALGNRSIICNPKEFSNLKRINDKIKGRDFWMPFTPTILDTYACKYLLNPIESKYMTMAFDSTDLAREHLKAAIHPADFTVRAQILKSCDNRAYYDLIDSFAKLTGVGALLNTSFNLHGDPIVCTPNDAIYTFINSELDGMILGDHLILRN